MLVRVVGGLLAESERDLRPYLCRWDALADACGRPYCSSAWMLAWWHNAAPPGSELRVAIAMDGEDIIGIAPLFAEDAGDGPVIYRLLGSGTFPRGHPIAAPGRERECADFFARAFAGAKPLPDMIAFEGIPSTSPWPQLLRMAWPGRRPWLYRDRSRATPSLTLSGGSFDEWMASKSRHFRKHMNRARRRLLESGADFRLARTQLEVEEGLASFVRLHEGRWRWRGGSRFVNSNVESMLREAALEMVPELRFRLWSIEIGGLTISSHVFLAAGGEVAHWLGGFDPDWADYQPSLQAILLAIEHGYKSGDRRLDLGAGKESYKQRFADSEEVLQRVILGRRTLGGFRVLGGLWTERVDGGVRTRLAERSGKRKASTAPDGPIAKGLFRPAER